ncbi:MAG: hypothetical protein A4E48_00224 [Methanosaeta sp. PtaU1.Bin060]|nr:MAG: hypothetical protein A4E48_00224 [Methanosaeta sp. PtaU1.Bin060]
MISLLASAARTASGMSVLSIPVLRTVRGAVFLFNVSAASADITDTLDLYIQGSVDGTNYSDFVHFTQVKGNGGPKVYEARWFRDISPETELDALSDKAMAVGVSQGPQANSNWRAAWVIEGGSNKSFTFSLMADLFR